MKYNLMKNSRIILFFQSFDLKIINKFLLLLSWINNTNIFRTIKIISGDLKNLPRLENFTSKSVGKKNFTIFCVSSFKKILEVVKLILLKIIFTT